MKPTFCVCDARPWLFSALDSLAGLSVTSSSFALAREMTDVARARAFPARAPLARVLAVRHANSAFHASAIGVKHACELLERTLRDAELLHGVTRSQARRPSHRPRPTRHPYLPCTLAVTPYMHTHPPPLSFAA